MYPSLPCSNNKGNIQENHNVPSSNKNPLKIIYILSFFFLPFSFIYIYILLVYPLVCPFASNKRQNS